MKAALLRKGPRWAAIYRRGGLVYEVTADTRQGAVEALHEISGVWLGQGPAPRLEVAHG